MALKLQKTIKGVIAEYWVISLIAWNKLSDKTQVYLSSYLNKDVRLESLENTLSGVSFDFEGELDLADAYVKIKESKLEKRIITPAKNAVLDIDGNIIEPAVEEVSEMVETNEFIAAIDC